MRVITITNQKEGSEKTKAKHREMKFEAGGSRASEEVQASRIKQDAVRIIASII
jgi:hypothetical protein